MNNFPKPSDYSSPYEWAKAWNEYIEAADEEHDRLKSEDPEHPQTCCSEECGVCDSLGLNDFYDGEIWP